MNILNKLTVQRDAARDLLDIAQKRIAELERQLQERTADLRKLRHDYESVQRELTDLQTAVRKQVYAQPEGSKQ